MDLLEHAFQRPWSSLAAERPASVAHHQHVQHPQQQPARSASVALPTLDEPTPHRNPLQCVECGIWKMGEEAMEVHINLEHLNWLPFRCRLCGEHRASADQMREHVFSRHRNEVDADLYLYRDNPSAARSSRALMEKVRIRAKPTPSNEDNAGGRTPLACGNSEMPPPPVPTVSIAELNASLFSSLDEGGEIPARLFGNQQQHSADAVNRGQHRRAGAELLAGHFNGANERNNSCEMRERRQEMQMINAERNTAEIRPLPSSLAARTTSKTTMRYIKTETPDSQEERQHIAAHAATANHREHEAAETLRLLRTASQPPSAAAGTAASAPVTALQRALECRRPPVLPSSAIENPVARPEDDVRRLLNEAMQLRHRGRFTSQRQPENCNFRRPRDDGETNSEHHFSRPQSLGATIPAVPVTAVNEQRPAESNFSAIRRALGQSADRQMSSMLRLPLIQAPYMHPTLIRHVVGDSDLQARLCAREKQLQAEENHVLNQAEEIRDHSATVMGSRSAETTLTTNLEPEVLQQVSELHVPIEPVSQENVATNMNDVTTSETVAIEGADEEEIRPPSASTARLPAAMREVTSDYHKKSGSFSDPSIIPQLNKRQMKERLKQRRNVLLKKISIGKRKVAKSKLFTPRRYRNVKPKPASENQIELLDAAQVVVEHHRQHEPQGRKRKTAMETQKHNRETSQYVELNLNDDKEQSPELSTAAKSDRRFLPGASSSSSTPSFSKSPRKSRLLKELLPYPPVPQPEIALDEPRRTRRAGSVSVTLPHSGNESDSGTVEHINDEFVSNVRRRLLRVKEFKVPHRKRKILLSETSSSEFGEMPNDMPRLMRIREQRSISKDSDISPSRKNNAPSPARSDHSTRSNNSRYTTSSTLLIDAEAAARAVSGTNFVRGCTSQEAQQRKMPLKKRPLKVPEHLQSPERQQKVAENVFQSLAATTAIEDDILEAEASATSFETTSTRRDNLSQHSLFAPFAIRPTRCVPCKRVFQTSAATAHVYNHLGRDRNLNRFRCIFCGKETTRRDHIRKHLQRIHESEDSAMFEDRAEALAEQYQSMSSEIMTTVKSLKHQPPKLEPIGLQKSRNSTNPTIIVTKPVNHCIRENSSTETMSQPRNIPVLSKETAAGEMQIVVKRKRGRPKGSFKKRPPVTDGNALPQPVTPRAAALKTALSPYHRPGNPKYRCSPRFLKRRNVLTTLEEEAPEGSINASTIGRENN